MNWKNLLSSRRISHDGKWRDSFKEHARSPFERDWDKVLFSNAFRRMHDKTQVFPLPDDDVTHSRLTHSLEVSSVGRSLGKMVGAVICPKYNLDVSAHDVGMIVATACLAHDIGNPPFGHAGEDAIATFFRTESGSAVISSLSEREKSDLTNFEGNAQGFRVLTRTQLEIDGGLQLCAATLAAYTKYPRASGPGLKRKGVVSTKKHGFLQDDRDIFAAVADEVQLEPLQEGLSWHRHPLALLVEAADDVCYSILDIEDGARLGHVEWDEAFNLMTVLASKRPQFDSKRNAQWPLRERIGYLRAMAITQLVGECTELFLAKEQEILSGTYVSSLTDEILSHRELADLKNLAIRCCYNAPSVVEIELAGYEALGGMLAHFVPAISAPLALREARPGRERKAVALLRGRGVNVDEEPLYRRVLRVTDLVSGMTDRYALSTYRRLKGISVPGKIS